VQVTLNFAPVGKAASDLVGDANFTLNCREAAAVALGRSPDDLESIQVAEASDGNISLSFVVAAADELTEQILSTLGRSQEFREDFRQNLLRREDDGLKDVLMWDTTAVATTNKSTLAIRGVVLEIASLGTDSMQENDLREWTVEALPAFEAALEKYLELQGIDVENVPGQRTIFATTSGDLPHGDPHAQVGMHIIVLPTANASDISDDGYRDLVDATAAVLEHLENSAPFEEILIDELKLQGLRVPPGLTFHDAAVDSAATTTTSTSVSSVGYSVEIMLTFAPVGKPASDLVGRANFTSNCRDAAAVALGRSADDIVNIQIVEKSDGNITLSFIVPAADRLTEQILLTLGNSPEFKEDFRQNLVRREGNGLKDVLIWDNIATGTPNSPTLLTMAGTVLEIASVGNDSMPEDELRNWTVEALPAFEAALDRYLEDQDIDMQDIPGQQTIFGTSSGDMPLGDPQAQVGLHIVVLPTANASDPSSDDYREHVSDLAAVLEQIDDSALFEDLLVDELKAQGIRVPSGLMLASGGIEIGILFKLELANGKTDISASQRAALAKSVEESVAEAHWTPRDHIETIKTLSHKSRRLSIIPGNFSFTYRVTELDVVEEQIILALSATDEYRERFEQFLIANEAANSGLQIKDVIFEDVIIDPNNKTRNLGWAVESTTLQFQTNLPWNEADFARWLAQAKQNQVFETAAEKYLGIPRGYDGLSVILAKPRNLDVDSDPASVEVDIRVLVLPATSQQWTDTEAYRLHVQNITDMMAAMGSSPAFQELLRSDLEENGMPELPMMSGPIASPVDTAAAAPLEMIVISVAGAILATICGCLGCCRTRLSRCCKHCCRCCRRCCPCCKQYPPLRHESPERKPKEPDVCTAIPPGRSEPCGATLAPHDECCPSCGAKRQKCACGEFFVSDSAYCISCGAERPAQDDTVKPFDSDAEDARKHGLRKLAVHRPKSLHDLADDLIGHHDLSSEDEPLPDHPLNLWTPAPKDELAAQALTGLDAAMRKPSKANSDRKSRRLISLGLPGMMHEWQHEHDRSDYGSDSGSESLGSTTSELLFAPPNKRQGRRGAPAEFDKVGHQDVTLRMAMGGGGLDNASLGSHTTPGIAANPHSVSSRGTWRSQASFGSSNFESSRYSGSYASSSSSKSSTSQPVQLREHSMKAVVCASCGSHFAHGAEFCKKCGMRRPEICVYCGTAFHGKESHCSQCNNPRHGLHMSEADPWSDVLTRMAPISNPDLLADADDISNVNGETPREPPAQPFAPHTLPDTEIEVIEVTDDSEEEGVQGSVTSMPPLHGNARSDRSGDLEHGSGHSSSTME